MRVHSYSYPYTYTHAYTILDTTTEANPNYYIQI